VVRHIARLPTPQREVLELRFRDALSYAEIASRLQLPLGTVHSRMARAKELIRTRVDDRSPAVDETRKSGDSVSPNPTPHESRDQPPSKDLTAGGQTGC
jgi:predicted RNA polymerase sigma factor